MKHLQVILVISLLFLLITAGCTTTPIQKPEPLDNSLNQTNSAIITPTDTVTPPPNMTEQPTVKPKNVSEIYRAETEDMIINKAVKMAKDDGDYEAVLKEIDRVIELNPKSEYGWYNRGITLYNLNRYEEAVEAFDKLESFNDHFMDGRGWEIKGDSLFYLGRYAEAMESYEHIQFAEPKNRNITLTKLKDVQPDLYKKYIVTDLIEEGDNLFGRNYSASVEKYKEALEIDPTNKIALNGRDRASRYIIN